MTLKRMDLDLGFHFFELKNALEFLQEHLETYLDTASNNFIFREIYF